MKNPQAVAQFLKQGKLVIFPTDTVWGIGCSTEKPETIRRLYEIKGRLGRQPTAVLVASLDQAKKLGQFSARVERAARRLWPGAVTLIVPATAQAPPEVLGTEKKIGLRIPQHPWLLAVLEEVTSGIVATSANFVGRPAPLRKTLIEPELIHQVDIVIEGVQAGKQLASTVVDTTTQPVTILRAGTVAPTTIQQLFTA